MAKKKTTKKAIKKSSKKVKTPKRIEYAPLIDQKQVVVKFNKPQLEDILSKLRNSGAREIGVPVIPIK